jgi:hypothetical protein
MACELSGSESLVPLPYLNKTRSTPTLVFFVPSIDFFSSPKLFPARFGSCKNFPVWLGWWWFKIGGMAEQSITTKDRTYFGELFSGRNDEIYIHN